MALIFLCIGWLAGLYLGLAYGAGALRDPLLQETWAALGVLAAIAGLAALLGRDDRTLRLTGLSLACALLGIWRAFASLPDPADAALRLDGVTALHGTVAERPEARDSSLQVVVQVDQIQRGQDWEPAGARVLVRTDRYDQWLYGDTLIARGEVRPVSGPGYWAEYLARKGIYWTVDYARVERGEPDPGPNPLRAVDEVRDRLQTICALLLPEPQASLLAGILVGGRAGMPQEFKAALNTTGTSHLVAVSGFNVTVVAGVALLAGLRFFSRRWATLLALVTVWVYTVLTGLPPSAVRAAVMATLVLCSVLAGRGGGDALAFLLLSATAMTALDPALLYDLGFQLSFLATAGLVLLEPPLRGLLASLPGPLGRLPAWLASSLTVTVAAQLATMPVLSSSFHTLSIVSPFSNLLIAPALPGLMLTGAVAVSLGSMLEALGRLAAPLAWVYLTYMAEIVELTAAFPRASIPTGGLEPLQIGAYYLVLLGFALWPLPEAEGGRDWLERTMGRVPRWALLASAAATLSLAALVLAARPDGRLHIQFLDVGHGDATLIRSPEGHSLLIDGGPSPVNLENALGSRMGFLDRSLDAVVLTGYGQDRLAGLIEAARRHPIGLVIEPDRPEGSRAGAAWAEVVAEKQLPVDRGEVGQRVDLGGGNYLEVVWASPKEDREPSLALKVVSGGTTVLIPGDLPPAAQRELARLPEGRVEVLRVPGQGAAGALDETFAKAASPRIAVVSVAPNNRFNHPSESTLETLAGATVFRTDRHGTVELVIDRNGGYEVYTER